MKISIVTDEISADVETAIELGTEWGLREFELRGFYAERVPNLSAYQVERLGNILADYGAKIIAISPGLFKIPYPLGRRQEASLARHDQGLFQRRRSQEDAVRYHREELLPASLEFARSLGVKLVLTFGFHRNGHPAGPTPDEVLETLQDAADQALGSGLELVVEVEEDFWADTGERTAAMMAALDHPALGVNWDPGNAFMAGDTHYPDGYEAVRPWVRHVHFKDAEMDSQGQRRYAVNGQIDWAGQIQALARDGYSGYISVETHLRPKVKTAREELAKLRRLIGQAV
ncbi:MAG: sugar phosphate isomerase/epimerase family protein [Anaerolineae bacterium]